MATSLGLAASLQAAAPTFLIAGNVYGGVSGAFDGSNFLVAIPGDGVSPNGEAVQFISQTGAAGTEGAFGEDRRLSGRGFRWDEPFGGVGR